MKLQKLYSNMREAIDVLVYIISFSAFMVIAFYGIDHFVSSSYAYRGQNAPLSFYIKAFAVFAAEGSLLAFMYWMAFIKHK